MVKLKKKLPSMIIACFMAIVMMVSVAVPAFAATASVGSVAEDANGGVAVGQDTDQGKQTLYSPGIPVGDAAIEEECDVYVTVAESDIMVTVPKVVILDGGAGVANSGEYTVKVQGDVSADTIISVEPQDEVFDRAGVNFEMSSVGKENIYADVDQLKTLFTYADGMRADTPVSTTGTITAHGMTAGQWNGDFVFNIGAVGKTTKRTVKVDMVQEGGLTFTYGEYYDWTGTYRTGKTDGMGGTDFIPIENYDENVYAVAAGYAVWDAEKNYIRGNYDLTNITLDPSQGDAYVTLSVFVNEDGTPTGQSHFVMTRDVEVSNIPQTFEIFGDSHSAMAGYTLEGRTPYYLGEGKIYGDDTLTTDVSNISDMWFSQLENQSGLNLVRNDAWSGTSLSYYAMGGQILKEGSFVKRVTERFEDSSLADPDMFIIYGGINDYNAGVPVGTAKYSDWTESDFETFLPSLCYIFDTMKQNAPDSEIVYMMDFRFFGSNATPTEYETGIKAVCDYYGVTCIKLQEYDRGSDAHPTVEGMTRIKDSVMWNLSQAGLI